MFLRLLWESFARQRRRKLLAGVAILLGTTAVTAMLALATTIGDRIHWELAVYGANIVVYPKAELLDVKVGGVEVKPETGGAYLKESDLEKLHGIFWANNITGVSPELLFDAQLHTSSNSPGVRTAVAGYWFDHKYGSSTTGAKRLHPLWQIRGKWPQQIPRYSPCAGLCPVAEVAVGKALAAKLETVIGDYVLLGSAHSTLCCRIYAVSGIASTDSELDDGLLMTLPDAQIATDLPDAVSRVEVSARTKPEDAFARMDPDKLTGKLHDRWYCSPYANSIAYQIQEAIPGAKAEQVRRVEQTEGTVLSRISGLMWLVSGAALLAAGFAVSAAMATAVLERQREIGLMRSLGASKGAIAGLFYAETGLLAVLAGTAGYLGGSVLAFWLGARIFSGENGPGDGTLAVLNPVLLPVIVAMALVVAVAGSAPSIRRALAMDPSTVLRGDG